MMDFMWFDGAVRHRSAIGVDPFTHALHYGSGVFEGLRAYRTERGASIFRLDDHLERLFASASVYGLTIPYGLETLRSAILATMTANSFSDGYIRPLAFFGERGISLAPKFTCPTHTLIALKLLSGSLIGGGKGARICVSPWLKTPSRALPSTVKACGHYTNSVLALQDAYARGYDEALLLNDRGEVAEGSGENIFVVKHGRLRTNDASADILEGITRDTVIRIARDLHIPVDVGVICLSDILEADELFFTGTAAEIMPITHVDEHALPPEQPLAAELKRIYDAAVRGQDGRYTDWLCRIP